MTRAGRRALRSILPLLFALQSLEAQTPSSPWHPAVQNQDVRPARAVPAAFGPDWRPQLQLTIGSPTLPPLSFVGVNAHIGGQLQFEATPREFVIEPSFVFGPMVSLHVPTPFGGPGTAIIMATDRPEFRPDWWRLPRAMSVRWSSAPFVMSGSAFGLGPDSIGVSNTAAISIGLDVKIDMPRCVLDLDQLGGDPVQCYP